MPSATHLPATLTPVKRAFQKLLFSSLLLLLCADLQAYDLLLLAKEPAFVRQAGIEQYRFIYSPTFSFPMIVRVTKIGDRVTLRAIQFSGAGGYDPGRVTVDRTIALTLQDWQRITAVVVASRFWTLPSEEEVEGNDGTSWILEGSKPDALHSVSRWTPTYNTKERQLERFLLFGRYLMSLSGLKIEVH